MEIILFALVFVLVFVRAVAAVFGWRGVRVLAGLFLVAVTTASIAGGVKLYNDAHPHYTEFTQEMLDHAHLKLTPAEAALEERLAKAGRPSTLTPSEQAALARIYQQ